MKPAAGENEIAARIGTFNEAKATLYSTISSAGAALDRAARRRHSTVESMSRFIARLQLDISELSVVHVTGTKGKGSTCAMVESILRRHGYRTGLFTSPHLLEVTERIRLDGKPIAEEIFARSFFQVWDRLQSTRGAEGLSPESEVADMPTYFSLLTLVGLWIFVERRVDVCIMEVGMGGRYDATNVVPAPVACGVAMLDLDHTQVLGETLEEIAWEKGGIFKEGSQAFTVEQPRGGMTVLRQCAEDVGGKLLVVPPLPTLDAAGVPYKLGLGGEHQKINAALALTLCAAWIRAREQTSTGGNESRDIYPTSGHPSLEAHPVAREAEGHRPPRLVEDSRVIEDNEVFFASEAVHRGLSMCTWPGRCQVFRPPSYPAVTLYLDGAHTGESIRACLRWFLNKTAVAAREDASHEEYSTDVDAMEASAFQQRQSNRCRRRVQRVLWFHASHERDVLALLDPLASARVCETRESHSKNSHRAVEGLGVAEHDSSAVLFDEVYFMKLSSMRPSRFKPPTAREILQPYGLPVATEAQLTIGKRELMSLFDSDKAAKERSTPSDGLSEPESTRTWQQTLEQVWVELQARLCSPASATGTGTAPEALQRLECLLRKSSEDAAEDAGNCEGEQVSPRGLDGSARVDVLCTGSLYAIAEILQLFGAKVV